MAYLPISWRFSKCKIRLDTHQFMSSEHKWTLFVFVSKFQTLCKFCQLETSVSDFGLALCVQAVHVVHIVRGEVRHVFTSAGTELNDVAGRQQSDQIDEEQKPFVWEEGDDISPVSAPKQLVPTENWHLILRQRHGQKEESPQGWAPGLTPKSYKLIHTAHPGPAGLCGPTCHPAHGVDDKRELSLVGAEHILYYVNVILVVVFTSSFPIIHHFLRRPLVGERWS